MRTKNSLKNFVSGLSINIITNILSFISRTVFITVLGKSYLGVNGLLANVLSMLSLAELGIGTAINFSLYKPLAEKDEKKVAILMNFYKLSYRWIGALVFVIGLILMIFLDVIIKEPGNVKNLRLIFFIYLVNTSYSYFMTYKVSLLNAHQKGYLVTTINILFSFINTITQMIVLIVAKNYILYLLTNMIILFIQRVYINKKIDKLYPILKVKIKDKLPKEELNIIIKNVKAMMFHKIGDYCINGTDNIIISAYISVSVVGIYSNYLMIISIVNSVIVLFFNSMTASMGNLIATESSTKKRDIFDVINFIGFWLYGFASVCLYNLLNPFIKLWIGNSYLLPQSILVVVILNYYLTGMRVPVHTVKAAAGLYDEDKYTPIIQSIVNLCVSIILVSKLGLIGVFIGTLVSSIVLPCWQRPYIVCKYALNISSKKYFVNYIKYLSTVIITTLLISYISQIFFLEVTIINFIIRMVICLLVPNIVFLLIFKKSKELIEILDIVNGISGGRLKWIKRLA